jgi:hypothetical protein
VFTDVAERSPLATVTRIKGVGKETQSMTRPNADDHAHTRDREKKGIPTPRSGQCVGVSD